MEDIYEALFNSICNLAHKLNHGGVNALIEKEKSVRILNLNELQRTALKDLILNTSSEEFDYNRSIWKGILLMDWIKNNDDGWYKKVQIYNIMKSCNLTLHKGKDIFPEIIDR